MHFFWFWWDLVDCRESMGIVLACCGSFIVLASTIREATAVQLLYFFGAEDELKQMRIKFELKTE